MPRNFRHDRGIDPIWTSVYDFHSETQEYGKLNPVFRFFAPFAAAIAAYAQGVSPQPARDAALARTLDNVRTALEAVRRDCAENNARSLPDSLKKANEEWTRAYTEFYEMPTSDTSWKSDFDAVNTALTTTVAKYSSGSSPSTLKSSIDSALSTLGTLRSRNGVPDLRAALDSVEASLSAMEQVIDALRGKKLTPEEIAQLQANLTEASESWSEFTNAVADVNALSLNDRQLSRFRNLVEAQDRLFERMNNALATENRRELVAALSREDRPLTGIMLLLGFPVPKR